MRFNKAYINTTKLASEIRKNHFKPGKHLSTVYVGNEQREKNKPEEEKMKVRFSINLESEEPVEFTYFDFMVCDALYSIHHNKEERAEKNITVTLGEILRMMSGNSSQTATAAKKKVIKESVQKLSATDVCIDFSKEAEARKLTNIESTFIEGKIAPLIQCGNNPDKFMFTGSMPLYQYAEFNNQMISYPVSLLESGLSDTNEVMMIKHLLIKRLELLRHPGNSFSSPDISYFRRNSKGGSASKWAGLLPEIGISVEAFSSPAAWNKKIRSVHHIVAGILDEFKSKGYIFGYTVVSERGIPVKVTLLSGKKSNGGGPAPYAVDPWELKNNKT